MGSPYIKGVVLFILALCVYITPRFVAAVRVPSYLNNFTGVVNPTNSSFKAFSASSFGGVALTGGYQSCYFVSMNIAGIQMSISIDSGSTDMAVAGAGLNNYNDAAGVLSISKLPNSPTSSGHYADGSWWAGFGIQSNVSLNGSTISAKNAPLVVMTAQSTFPIFVKGTGTPNQQGLMGIAYPSLSQFSFSPPTVVDAWYAQKTISKNEIAFHACPYDRIAEAYIDFGNDSPSIECNPSGAPIAWALSPSRSYFTMDVRNISVNDQMIILPKTFQTTDSGLIGGDIKAWSFIDSCSTLIHVPAVVNTALKQAIVASGALSSALTPTIVENLLSGTYAYSISSYINWTALPTLSFDIVSDQSVGGFSKILTIVLGGHQYLQCDQNTYCTYLVSGDTEGYATLGIPVFSNLLVTLDRTNGRVGFSPGCGCTTGQSPYPQVSLRNTTIKRTWDPSTPSPNAAYSKATHSTSVILFVSMANVLFADRVPMFAPNQPSHRGPDDSLRERIVVNAPGGFSSCYLINMEVQGTTFNVMVDSGSTDLTIPLAGLNNYAGPTIDTPRPLGGRNLSGSYGDHSGWTGYGIQGSVLISGTNITANNTPIIAMFKQTTNPVFTSGTPSQGLLGIAYSALASYKVVPATAVDAWFSAGAIPKNEIAFRACPYGLSNQSYIDFGNTQPTYTCSSNGVPVVWAYSPVRSYFTLDIRSISINSSPISLPSTFQNVTGYRKWSLIDSCTSVLMVPSVVLSSLLDEIRSSGGIPSDLAASAHYSDFLNGRTGVIPRNAFNWTKLPTVSFDITSDQMTTAGSKNATFRVTLGPKQYLQRNDNGYLLFLESPSFTNLNVVLDRKQGRVGFSLGCGCETTTDKFPSLTHSNGTVWRAGVPTPISPPPRTLSSTTATSTSTNIPPMATTILINTIPTTSAGPSSYPTPIASSTKPAGCVIPTEREYKPTPTRTPRPRRTRTSQFRLTLDDGRLVDLGNFTDFPTTSSSSRTAHSPSMLTVTIGFIALFGAYLIA
ncbi:hypothetical protein BASA60_002083 [Batrachochytrium salamandrivorans]|nr:hypothetical protein BASA60_002083 [Batrachochytrium salamandrivorans]